MYVSPWLQAAILPAKWDVCGFILHTLTIWHAHVLRATGNVYLVGGTPTIDDGVEVMLYASRDIAGGRRLLTQPNHRDRERFRFCRRAAKIEWSALDWNIREYVGGCMRTPGHTEWQPGPNDKGARSIKAPLEWVLLDFLTRGNPAGIEAAWNTPIAVARCLWDAHRDAAGESNSLISERDEERIDRKLEAMESQ
jgi:hypothetical protein